MEGLNPGRVQYNLGWDGVSKPSSTGSDFFHNSGHHVHFFAQSDSRILS
jgi:hypothetical protein